MLKKFRNSIQAEVKKLKWPSKSETVSYAALTITVSAIIATVIFLLESGVTQLVNLII